jgi:TRAP-type C4-dicarboxylate transport system permease small subunit
MTTDQRCSPIDRIDQAFGVLLDMLALLACALVALMVIVICADVLTRAARLGNLPWAAEVAEYTLYLSTFLAAPWLLREGKHVRMDMGLKAVPAHVAWAIELLADFVAAATCATLALASAKAALASAMQGSIVLKIFVFPEWWLITPAAVLFAVLSVEFGFRFRRQWLGPKTVRNEATSAA